ncbi:MAG TPA: biopolymer transporter ExbD [Bacteroidales bacterium]|nr:biopolymer transporter ExbD [Bacteroidales bacterium]HPI86379.1 biopolymer transporter ExbD [Bacteroidales bacterium]
MPIRTRNKLSATFSMASMSDLVFLLLIFFMITSTLVAPNAIKLLLPSSNSKTMAKQTVTVYINDQQSFFVEENQVTEDLLKLQLEQRLADITEGTVVLKADKTVDVQYIVTVIDAVNSINQEKGTKHKVILATIPK